MAGMFYVYLCAQELVNAFLVQEFDCAATGAAHASWRKRGRFEKNELVRKKITGGNQGLQERY
jgi:hypothetical protein